MPICKTHFHEREDQWQAQLQMVWPRQAQPKPLGAYWILARDVGKIAN